MDAIERDLRTYGGVIKAAETRAAGIRTLLGDDEVRPLLEARGFDLTEAEHLEMEAAQIKTDYEEMRGLWARIQEVSARLHAKSGTLADEIRSIDDAARSALGRKSEHLPVLGIRPIGRPHAAKTAAKGAKTAEG